HVFARPVPHAPALGLAVGASVAAVAIALIARLASPWRGTHAAGSAPIDAHVRPLVAAALVQGAIAVCLQLDLFAVGRALGSADERWTGLYAQAQTLSILAYQLPTVVQTIAFPAVASAHAGGDREGLRGAI